MPNIKETFHSNFNRLFKEGGWSQPRFAAAAGLSTSRVHNYLEGSNTPNLENLEKIAKVFKISVADLITNDSKPHTAALGEEAIDQADLDKLVEVFQILKNWRDKRNRALQE